MNLLKNNSITKSGFISSEYIFIILVLVFTPLIFLRGLFDETLVSRFTFLSAFLCCYGILNSKKLMQIFRRKWLIIDYLILGFYVIHLLSAFWATNPSEALYVSQRISLFCILYFVFKHLLQQEGLFNKILVSIKILSVLLICFVGFSTCGTLF